MEIEPTASSMLPEDPIKSNILWNIRGCYTNCLGIVKTLLRAGAVVWCADDDGITARECAEHQDNDECVELLADAKVKWLIGVLESCPTMHAIPLDLVTLIANIATGRPDPDV